MANNLDASPADIKGSDISITNDTDFRARLEVLARDIEHIERTAIFKIALRLAEAHEHFVHRRDEGGFQGWVEDRLGYSRAHAYRLLNVASLIKVSQAWDTFGTLPVTAIYQIAAPSTPELAREGILERLKGGERLSCAAVNKIISDAKAAHPAAHGDDRDANHDDGEHHPGEDRAGGGERHDGAHGEENQGASKEEDLRRELPGAAEEADAQMSAERRKASNAALEIWDEDHQASKIKHLDWLTAPNARIDQQQLLSALANTCEGCDA